MHVGPLQITGRGLVSIYGTAFILATMMLCLNNISTILSMDVWFRKNIFKIHYSLGTIQGLCF